MRGRCFVIKENVVPGSGGRYMDFSPAERFGDVVFITSHDPSPNSGSTINKSILDQMNDVAEQYVPGQDYIIATGAPLAIFMMGAIMGQRHDTMAILVWDRFTQNYRPVAIDLREYCDART